MGNLLCEEALSRWQAVAAVCGIRETHTTSLRVNLAWLPRVPIQHVITVANAMSRQCPENVWLDKIVLSAMCITLASAWRQLHDSGPRACPAKMAGGAVCRAPSAACTRHGRVSPKPADACETDGHTAHSFGGTVFGLL
jgi:hypothetical protein